MISTDYNCANPWCLLTLIPKKNLAAFFNKRFSE